MMLQAHAELKKPMSPSKKRMDENSKIKEHLIEMLNSKASIIDLNQLKQEKTNKIDTDMQMRSIDIMHKQILQVSTVLLELIKQSVTTKKESETEK